MTPPPRSAASQAGCAECATALAIYAIASFAFFGIPLWGGFSHLRLGFESAGDPQIPMWGLAWYPYALAHRLDPLFTNAVWAPTGCTLVWSTTMPGAALAMWPVTRAVGIVATYNLLCLITPALSAFTTFALCRYLTGDFRASLAGGFIFGFSPYVSSQLLDHVSLAMVFLVPLFPYFGVAFLGRKNIGGVRARYVAALTALVLAQFLLSPEILATATVFGAIAIVLAMRTFDEAVGARLKSLTAIAAISYGLAALALAPYLARFFPSPFGITPVYNPAHCSTDLLNFLVPSDPEMLSRISAIRGLGESVARGCEPGAYLGLLPLVVLLFAAGHQRLPRERMMLAMLLIVVVATLGPILHVNGRALLPLPWLFATPIPLLNSALPARFAVYVFLLIAMIAAVWLARREGHAAGRWMLYGAALVSILPALPMTPYVARDKLPVFFEQGRYKQYIGADENVLVLPFAAAGYALLWQAEANFDFRIPQGRLLANTIPPGFARWPIVAALTDNDPYIPGYSAQFAAFLASHRIRTVLIDPDAEKYFVRLFENSGWRRSDVGGVVLYQIDPAGLAAFKSATAQEMATRYNLERFELLLHAARHALDTGLTPRDLAAFELRDRGAISTSLAGNPLRPQLSGYGVTAIRDSRAFARLLGWLARHEYIQYRLMAELGAAPAVGLTTSGVWLSPWGADSVAIGVVGYRQSVRDVIAKYGSSAAQIFYPYPLEYRADKPAADGQNLLVMIFPRAALAALDQSPAAAAAARPSGAN